MTLRYSSNAPELIGEKIMKVKFYVIETGAVVEKEFESEFLARKFVNKARRGKKIKIIQCPNFNW